MAPLIVAHDELVCMKEYLPLPQSLSSRWLQGLDISEQYFSPVKSFLTHEMTFTPQDDQDAVRVLLARGNAKITLIEENGRYVIAESRPIEEGKAQILEATELKKGTSYAIVLELSELIGMNDGEGARGCNHFQLAVKTWNSNEKCGSKHEPQDRDASAQSIEVVADELPTT